jgi:hypothetical protein
MEKDITLLVGEKRRFSSMFMMMQVFPWLWSITLPKLVFKVFVSFSVSSGSLGGCAVMKNFVSHVGSFLSSILS